MLEELREELLHNGSGHLFQEMPRMTLHDKLQDGPTAAHRVEEIHTPYNFAYITCTTGSSAFQNLVGVTQQELKSRCAAGVLALKRAGLCPGDRILITYPPLMSVFSRAVFDEMHLAAVFIERPSRDALLVALCTQKPTAVIGESSFLRAGLVDARRMGLTEELPVGLRLIAAGSPLDIELEEEVRKLREAAIHDLYGCQEFGWLCMDGIPLRKDIVLWRGDRTDERKHLFVGGLPTGDCFLTQKDPNGEERILTPTRLRAEVEPETWILESTAASHETVARVARTILRIKGKIVRVEKSCICGTAQTKLSLRIPGVAETIELNEPVQTKLFDELLEAQKMYQREGRGDPVWNKPC